LIIRSGKVCQGVLFLEEHENAALEFAAESEEEEEEVL
jgi:hypothetical protein